MRFTIAFAALCLAAPAIAQDRIEDIPTLQTEMVVMNGGFPFRIVGLGSEPYEFVSSGKHIDVRMAGDLVAPIGMMFPAEGDVVKVDPTVPMVWIADSPHYLFAEGAPWIGNYDAGQGLVLLEDAR